jgi:hypothetical protein
MRATTVWRQSAGSDASNCVLRGMRRGDQSPVGRARSCREGGNWAELEQPSGEAANRLRSRIPPRSCHYLSPLVARSAHPLCLPAAGRQQRSAQLGRVADKHYGIRYVSLRSCDRWLSSEHSVRHSAWPADTGRAPTGATRFLECVTRERPVGNDAVGKRRVHALTHPVNQGQIPDERTGIESTGSSMTVTIANVRPRCRYLASSQANSITHVTYYIRWAAELVQSAMSRVSTGHGVDLCSLRHRPCGTHVNSGR